MLRISIERSCDWDKMHLQGYKRALAHVLEPANAIARAADVVAL